MFVIYVTPWLTGFGVRVIGSIAAIPELRLGLISQDPLAVLTPELRQSVAAHWRVDDVLDAGQLEQAARGLVEQLGEAVRLFSAVEHLQVQLAEVRESLGIAGMPVDAALNFRDKARMKAVLRRAGVPVARFQVATDQPETWRGALELGLPVVLKPMAGAGTEATFRAGTDDELRQAIETLAPSAQQPVMVEEFLQGDESSFETFCRDGDSLWDSLTHYFPSPLEVTRNPWIQWVVLLPREIDSPNYDDIRQVNRQTLAALGMDTGLTHLEWFRRADGSIAVSEVAARPPGAQITTLISYANDFDCLAAWARLMVLGDFERPERRYAAGAAYLRGQGSGEIIRAIRGWDQVRDELGDLIVEASLPRLGQKTTGRYEGDGFVIVRHPETSVVQAALSRVVSLVRVELG